MLFILLCPCGGTGRRGGLKIRFPHGIGSSSLPGGTTCLAVKLACTAFIH